MDAHKMNGKLVVISGGSSGVGLAIAKGVSGLGARTILLSRSEGRALEAVREVRLVHPDAEASSELVDLTARYSVQRLGRRLAASESKIDVLINATGSVGERGEVVPGIPRSFATNYLSHFLLTNEMLPLLRNASTPRVLTVGAAPAIVQRLRRDALEGVNPQASGGKILAQTLAWKLLMSRFITEDPSDNVDAYVFHPGLIRSELLLAQPAPLRLLGSAFNLFASTISPVANYLASAPAPERKGLMFDSHGRPVKLPSEIDAGDALAVYESSKSLAARL